MVTVCWFVKFWHCFDLVKRVKFGVYGHFPENAWREWPEIVHANVSWPLSGSIRLWSQFVDFSNFGTILTLWNGSNLGFPAILVVLCGFSSLWCHFDWNWSYLGFLGIIWGMCGNKKKCRGGNGGIFPTLCMEFCLVNFDLWSVHCTFIGGT